MPFLRFMMDFSIAYDIDLKCFLNRSNRMANRCEMLELCAYLNKLMDRQPPNVYFQNSFSIHILTILTPLTILGFIRFKTLVFTVKPTVKSFLHNFQQNSHIIQVKSTRILTADKINFICRSRGLEAGFSGTSTD